MDDIELIRNIAVEVMEWHICNTNQWYNKYGQLEFIEGSWNPLTNANHWMMVVKRLHKLGWFIQLNNRVPSGEWSARLFKYQELNQPLAINEIIGHAVCLAALEAVRSSSGQSATKTK
jgi:hypothetical protein